MRVDGLTRIKIPFKGAVTLPLVCSVVKADYKKSSVIPLDFIAQDDRSILVDCDFTNYNGQGVMTITDDTGMTIFKTIVKTQINERIRS